MHRAYDLILLDWDGTLVHSMPSIEHTTRRTFEKAYLPVPSDAAMHTAIRDGKGLEFYLKLLHPGFTEAELPAISQAWRDIYDAESHSYTKPFPGAAMAMAVLAEAEIPLALFSNKGEPALHRSAAENGLDGFMQVMIGDLPGLPKKPHAEAFFERVVPHFPRLDPVRVLMVGDAESDLKFGKAFGGKTCFAAYGYGDHKICMAEQPDLIIENMTELAEHILTSIQG